VSDSVFARERAADVATALGVVELVKAGASAYTELESGIPS
jgi:hypothetical protein